MGTIAATFKALLRETAKPTVDKEMWNSVRRTRQDPHPPERADGLEDLLLRDHDGHEVRLGDHWLERPAALVFLRHWG